MKRFKLLHGTTRIGLLAAAASRPAAAANMEATGPRAEATLETRYGRSVGGTVGFRTVGQKLRVEARCAGLAPGEQGLHIHEAGDPGKRVACGVIRTTAAGGGY